MKVNLFNICLKSVSLLIFVLLIFAEQPYALEVETHSAINNYIADENSIINGFSLDKYLKDNLGLKDGVKTTFNSLMIKKWISDGGKTEDKPTSWCAPWWRPRNHFHNPIDNSGFSGVWDTGFYSGISAIEWALQPAGSQSCGYYSWYDARSYYYTALTALDKSTRETNFAKTFRALGQVMHLVQDMSVPEHTRNDGHYFGYDKVES